MTPYKDKVHGGIHDLDDPKICPEYENSPLGTIRLECMYQLGYALLVFQHLEKGIFEGSGQPHRVEKLCQELYANENIMKPDGYPSPNDNIQFWKSFLFRIKDEIENLC